MCAPVDHLLLVTFSVRSSVFASVVLVEFVLKVKGKDKVALVLN